MSRLLDSTGPKVFLPLDFPLLRWCQLHLLEQDLTSSEGKLRIWRPDPAVFSLIHRVNTPTINLEYDHPWGSTVFSLETHFSVRMEPCVISKFPFVALFLKFIVFRVSLQLLESFGDDDFTHLETILNLSFQLDSEVVTCPSSSSGSHLSDP